MKDKDEEFKSAFINEQYDFFTAKNMRFYIIDHHKGPTYIAMTPKQQDDLKVMRQTYSSSSLSIHSCYGKNDYLDKMRYRTEKYISCTDINDRSNLEFFTFFYNKHPEFRKTLLKEFYYYMVEGDNQESKLFNVTESLNLNSNKKQLASFIVSFPVSSWELSTIKIEKLTSYLEQKGFTSEETDKTLFSFLKSRKAQLKSPYSGNYIKDFLLERHNYQEEKLKDYFDFFPILHAHFEKPTIDFIVEYSKYDFNVFINFEKLKKSFLIDKWDVLDYQENVPIILNAIKKQHNLVHALINSEDKSDKSADILVLYNNESYSKEKFIKTFTAIFTYLQEQPDYKVTSENIAIWIQQKELTEKIDKEFPLKETNNTQKLKI